MNKTQNPTLHKKGTNIHIKVKSSAHAEVTPSQFRGISKLLHQVIMGWSTSKGAETPSFKIKTMRNF
jgi:hypothetical protein